MMVHYRKKLLFNPIILQLFLIFVFSTPLFSNTTTSSINTRKYIDLATDKVEITYPQKYFSITLEVVQGNGPQVLWKLTPPLDNNWLGLEFYSGILPTNEGVRTKKVTCEIDWSQFNAGEIKTLDLTLTDDYLNTESTFTVYAYNNSLESHFDDIVTPTMPVTASSTFDVQFSPSNITVSEHLKVWGSEHTTTPEWIFIDLGEVTMINGIAIEWFENYFAREFDIGISDDGVAWSIIDRATSKTNANYVLLKDYSCRFVGVLLKKRNDYVYAIDRFKVYKTRSDRVVPDIIDVDALNIKNDDINRLNSYKSIYGYSTYIFLAACYEGIKIYQEMPIYIKSVDTGGKTISVCGQNNYLYALNDKQGVQIYEIVNGCDLELRSTVEISKNLLLLKANGNTLYVIDTARKLHSIDITDVLNPQITLSFNLPLFDDTPGLNFFGDKIYVNIASKLYEYNLTNFADSTEYEYNYAIDNIVLSFDEEASTDCFYVTDTTNTLRKYTLDDLTIPYKELKIPTEMDIDKFCVYDTYIYALVYQMVNNELNYFFHVFSEAPDLINPGEYILKSESAKNINQELDLLDGVLGNLVISEYVFSSIFRLRKRIFLSLNEAGMLTYLIRDPKDPSILKMPTVDSMYLRTRKVNVFQNNVYVNTYNQTSAKTDNLRQSLQIFDVTSDTSPDIVSTIGTDAFLITNYGHNLFFQSPTNNELIIYDYADKQNPTLAGKILLENKGTVKKILFYKSFLLCLYELELPPSRAHWLLIYDIDGLPVKTPKKILETEIVFNKYSEDMVLKDDFLYIDAYDKIKLFSLADMQMLPVGGVYDYISKGTKLSIDNVYLYATSSSSNTMYIVDISNPYDPKLINKINSKDINNSIVYSNYIYTPYGDSLKVQNISNPYNLKYSKAIKLPGYIKDIIIEKNKLYVSMDDCGFAIIDDKRGN